MDAPPPASKASAEELFADYLDRIEGGETVDFAAFCHDHPQQAASLHRVHVRWQAMTRAFALMSQDSPTKTTASSSSLDDMRALVSKSHGRLARYTLGAEIARGAMGRIVAAYDEELRREVALKIHRGPVDDSRTQRRFFEEAQIAAQLDHPGIVPIHELGLDDDGRPFFSMQLVRGRDLGAILGAVQRGEDGWTRTRVLHVLLRVCEAMAFAHDKGVVHRDLKPANVMVGRFGETYVMDWGLARAQGPDGDTAPGDDVATLRTDIAGEPEASPLLTHVGDVIGTPAYMPPEQAAGGSHAAEPTLDVYAVGAMLYHLLAGHMPYDGDGASADRVLQRVRKGPPEPLGDEVPAELRAICERAMARLPAERYPSMVALGEDLRAFLEVRTVRAYATGRFAELRKWIARNKTLTAATALSFVLLLVGGIAVTSLWVRAEGNRERADANAARLVTELDRSAFRSARLALRTENSADAANTLWSAHFVGRMPRATAWTLNELAERDPYLMTIPVYTDNTAIAWAPKIAAVLVSGSDGRLQVRDDQSLALRAEWGEPGDPIQSIAVLGTGNAAVAGTQGGAVLCFELHSGQLLGRRTPHSGPIRNLVAVGATGFASGSSDKRVLWWVDPAAEPQTVLTLGNAVSALASHPNGSGVVAGDEQGQVLGRAFDRSWFVTWNFGSHVAAVAYDLPGKELWVGCTDQNLHVLEILQKGRERSVPTRNGTGRQLARDADGSFLLGGWWRIDRVSALGEPMPPVALRGISRIALDPQRRRLLTSGTVSGVGIVDLADRGRRKLAAEAIALSGDGKRVATLAGNKIEVRDVDSNAIILRLPENLTGALCLDDDGALLAICSKEQLAVYDVESGRHRFTVDGPSNTPFGDACVFSPDGSELTTRPGNERLLRVRTSDGSIIADYPIPGGRLFRAAYSHDGRWLASIQRRVPIVRRFDLRTGQREDLEFSKLLPGGGVAMLSAVAVSADGSKIAAGTWQGTVLVRGPDGETKSIAAHPGTVWALHFAVGDDGLLFSSGGSQGMACWDLDSSECCFQALQDVVSQLHVSDDGRTMACLTPEGALLFDLTYRHRHVAGNLAFELERLRDRVPLPAGREQELRAWADAVLARPWPRW